MIHLSIFAFLYFLPTLLAVRRGHEILPILLLNLFFGWTVIGWFAMLLWALCSYPYPWRCYYHPVPPPPPPPATPYASCYDPNHPYWRR
ncbi:MAG TPA: superinfection immunity protein [Acidobacteriaceae bacterium]|nr:superinfection immunity protein [Acidobacteriaceae bacterium]